MLQAPLDPWQQWVVIHLGELLPDGRPRFRQVLILVARQNGKTHLCKVLALYWLFVQCVGMVFGSSTNLDYAREAWEAAVDLAQSVPALAAKIPRNGVRRANGEQVLRTAKRSRYKIGVSGRKGGRSLSIDRIISDELREQHNWDAYNAAYNAMNARPGGQAVFISNQGDFRSVVLTSLRDTALEYIETGEGDERLGLFEYSAPDGAHPMDVAAQAQANPQLGRRMDYDTIRGAAIRVSKPGAKAEELAGFLTEVLCMRVDNLDAAIDPAAWAAGHVDGTLSDLRGRLAMVVDVSPDMQHATAVVAGLAPDGKVRGEIPGHAGVVAAWAGPRAVADMQRDLPKLVRAIRPQVFGWLPGGPAAAAAAGLKERKGRTAWPPPGVTVAEITGEVTAVCMALAADVDAGLILHSDDPLLTAQITGAAKLWQGDRWRFERAGDGYCDAAYAFAGAVFLARTLPTPVGKPRIILPRSRATA